MIELSYSGLNTFNSCPHKFMLKNYAPQKVREESLVAEVGKAMHEAIQYWFDTKDNDGAMFQLIQHYPYELFFLDQYGRRSIEACAVALDELFQSVDLQRFELVTINNKPAIELSFALHIDDKINYRGFIDLVLWDVIDECIVVCDIKTKDANSIDMAQYANDHQCTGYKYVLENLLGRQINDMKIMYLIINCNLTNPFHELLVFNHTKEREQEWLMDLALFAEVYSLYEAVNHFPRRATACISWGRRCPMFDICHWTKEQLDKTYGSSTFEATKQFDHTIKVKGLLTNA